MKTIFPALAVCTLMFSCPGEAKAAPFTGSLGFSYQPPMGGWTAVAVDLDVGLSDSPWGFMGNYQVAAFQLGESKPYPYYTNPDVLNGMVRYRTPASGEDTLTLFAGLNYNQGSFLHSEPGFKLTSEPFEPLVGFTYKIKSDRIWIALTPYYLFTLPADRNAYHWYVRSSIPFVEAGFSLSPSVDLSLRLSRTPIRAAFRF